jgi:hypothetical protein
MGFNRIMLEWRVLVRSSTSTPSEIEGGNLLPPATRPNMGFSGRDDRVYHNPPLILSIFSLLLGGLGLLVVRERLGSSEV